MPKASFDAWVRDTKVVSCDDAKLVISTSKPDARDWLESRLRSTVCRSLVGSLNRSVEVEFIVIPESSETEQPTLEQEDDLPKEDEADVQVVNRLHYDEVVCPSKVVAVPGYFSRLIPEIGARNAWLYIGWRQASWNGERSSEGGTHSRRIPIRAVIRYSGLSRRNFFRAVEEESTWEQLKGLVERQDVTPRWTRGHDHRGHRIPNQYLVHMTLRLTHADGQSILKWLRERIKPDNSLLDALRQAAGVKDVAGEMLAPVDAEAFPTTSFQTVMDIALHLNRSPLSADVQEAAEALHHRIVSGFGIILITHYFLETVIPTTGLTPAQAWLITLLRDRCYVNRDTGEVRDEVLVRGGYEELAGWLGLNRSKTVWEWIREDDSPVSTFVAVLPGIARDEANSLRLRVRLDEPIFDGVSDTIRSAQPPSSNGEDDTYKPGANGTNSMAEMAPMTGTGGTLKWREWHSLKHLNTDSNNTPQSTDTTSTKAAAVFPTTWVLRKLLIQNHAHPKVTKELLSKNASARALVSWLLFAFSPSGNGIKDPFAYAIASLRQEPVIGSGGAFDLLAKLPPSELIRLIDRTPTSLFEMEARGGTGCIEWDTAMGLANPGLKTLRKILIGEDHL
jgi:hypothetical protein